MRSPRLLAIVAMIGASCSPREAPRAAEAPRPGVKAGAPPPAPVERPAEVRPQPAAPSRPDVEAGGPPPAPAGKPVEVLPKPAAPAPPAPPERARAPAAAAPAFAGLGGPVGAPPGARQVDRLIIDRPGVYENLVIDGAWGDHDLVRIRADNVVLRNCTIRHGRRDGVEVYARNVLIENCRIHHLLGGTFKEQHDAHGITGRPLDLTVRNTEIAYLSGDGLQFDPDRAVRPYPWDNVLVENCFVWTGPLDRDCAGFKRGERPGENAFDSKTNQGAPRARITLRRCLLKGWGHGQIDNGAALNLKERIQAVVEDCVLVENDIGFRCRGTQGSAWVTARNCAVYETSRAWRLEDRVQNVKLRDMAYGKGVEREIERSGGGHGPGFEDGGSRPAPPLVAWPYDRIPILPAPGPAVDPALLATGWKPEAAGFAVPAAPGGGASLALELFGGGR